MKNKTFLIKTSNNKDTKEHTLLLQGDLGIKNAEALREAIMALKFGTDTIVIELKNVEKLDLTTIQNVTALKNSLMESGKKVDIRLDVSQDIERLLNNTGFKVTL